MSTFEELHQNRTPPKRTFSQKIGKFWLEYGNNIVLALGIALIGLICFEAGFLKGKKSQTESVVVNQPACLPAGKACAPCPKPENQGDKTPPSLPPLTKGSTEEGSADNQNCAYAASKNSDKFHLASCQWAAKIKPENKVCFSSAEEAAARGYQPAKCCIK
jgi:hypothetical protein